MTDFVPMSTDFFCKNINQPYTGENVKHIILNVELLTSHLKRKSKLTNGDGGIHSVLHYLFIYIKINFWVLSIYRADNVLGSKDSMIEKKD